MTAVLWFVASGAAVVAAGVALARAADAIAEATGIGRLWIGSVVLAAATSLPEASTVVVAARLGAFDLAAGDLFGACMSNMFTLALVDLMPPRRSVLRNATLDNALAACLAIALLALAGVLVLVRPAVTVLGVSPGAAGLLVLYVAGTRAVYRHAQRDAPGGRIGWSGARWQRLRRPLATFAVATAVIVAAAPTFAGSAQDIAEQTGLGATFVGTWLVGFSTSLPELVAAVAAVRMGAYDLAVGNLFGSNGFNMALFFLLDLAAAGPAVFVNLDPSHALSSLIAVLLTSLGLAAIVYRAERRFAMIEPDSLVMVFAYLAAIVLLYGQAVPH